MELFECIHKRRSIREFLDKPVSEDDLYAIMEAGTAAPSAGNMQAREFILVRTRDSIEKAVAATDAGGTSRGGENTQKWISKAAVIVIICYEEKRMAARYGDKGRSLMTKLDCMGVAENMMLAITALGLGTTCVIGFHTDKLKKNLQIPPELTPLLMLPIGWPAEEKADVFRISVNDLIRMEC